MNRFCVVVLLAALLTSGCVRMPKTAAQDSSIAHLMLNDHHFHYQTQGDTSNPVVIVLHGGPGADSRYLTPLLQLSDEYFVVLYDQLGTGLSERVPSEQISVDTFVRDLDAFVNHFGKGEPVYLVGHSWGAMLGSRYTGQYPQKVRGLVLAEPGFIEYKQMQALQKEAGGPSISVILSLTKAWLSQWFATGDEYAKSDYFAQQAILSFQAPSELCDGKLPPMELYRFGYSNFEATIGKVMSDETFAHSLHFAEGMDQYPHAVLMLTGGCNKLTGYDYQNQFLPYYQSAELKVVPNAGHFLFNEQPELAIELIKEHFQGLSESQ